MEFEKYLINVCDAFRNPSRSKSTEKGNEIAERVATSTQFIGNNNGILTCTKRPGIHIDLTKVPDNCIEPTAIAFVSWVIGSRNDDENLEEFLARIEMSVVSKLIIFFYFLSSSNKEMDQDTTVIKQYLDEHFSITRSEIHQTQLEMSHILDFINTNANSNLKLKLSELFIHGTSEEDITMNYYQACIFCQYSIQLLIFNVDSKNVDSTNVDSTNVDSTNVDIQFAFHALSNPSKTFLSNDDCENKAIEFISNCNTLFNNKLTIVTAKGTSLSVVGHDDISLDLKRVPSDCVVPMTYAFGAWVMGAFLTDEKDIWSKLREFLAAIDLVWNPKNEDQQPVVIAANSRTRIQDPEVINPGDTLKSMHDNLKICPDYYKHLVEPTTRPRCTIQSPHGRLRALITTKSGEPTTLGKPEYSHSFTRTPDNDSMFYNQLHASVPCVIQYMHAYDSTIYPDVCEYDDKKCLNGGHTFVVNQQNDELVNLEIIRNEIFKTKYKLIARAGTLSIHGKQISDLQFNIEAELDLVFKKCQGSTIDPKFDLSSKLEEYIMQKSNYDSFRFVIMYVTQKVVSYQHQLVRDKKDKARYTHCMERISKTMKKLWNDPAAWKHATPAGTINLAALKEDWARVSEIDENNRTVILRFAQLANDDAAIKALTPLPLSSSKDIVTPDTIKNHKTILTFKPVVRQIMCDKKNVVDPDIKLAIKETYEKITSTMASKKSFEDWLKDSCVPPKS